jgi:hypothetical protein
MVTGAAVAPVVTPSVGVDTAVNTTLPLTDGFQVQLVVKLELEPVAIFNLHPGITTPPALKVTFEATVTSALIVDAFLYTAVVAPPVIPNELKLEVKVTVIFPLVTGVALDWFAAVLRANTLKL